MNVGFPQNNAPRRVHKSIQLMNDKMSLELLQLLCSGEGVNINYSELSKYLKKHRNTIKKRTYQLINNNIISKPYYPYVQLFKDYTLLVISKDEFSRDEFTRNFIEKSSNIFAAFFYRDEVYNTLTIQFHKDFLSYQTWWDQILNEGKITNKESRHPSNALFFSTRRIFKFDPAAPLDVIEKGFLEGTINRICGLKLDSLSLNILKMVTKGKGIRTNENYIARKLAVNRKTVQRKIQAFLDKGLIAQPVSRFSTVIVPPGFILVLSLFEVNKKFKDTEIFMISNPHVTVFIKANAERYNYFTMSAFSTIEKHLEWQEECVQRFPGCIEAIKNIYLSPVMAFKLKQNYLDLKLIEKKLSML